MFESLFATLGVLTLVAESGKALITWTPTTFYVAVALVHIPVIWGGYRILGGDAEYANFATALAATAIGNLVAFLVRDFGVVGFVITAMAFYGLLVMLSGTDIFRSVLVFFLVLGTYGVFGNFVTERTPLDAYEIGGVAKVIMTGGFEPEPMEEGGTEVFN